MRRVFFLSLAGVLVSACAGPEVTRPPTEATTEAATLPEPTASYAKGATAALSPTAALDDALLRLVPALGPNASALAAPLRQLRDGRLDPVLLDATRKQLASITKTLPSAAGPDADALSVSLDALYALATKK